MKSDGTIWIDTKIDESGMKDGFNRMRDGADDVATSFRNAGKVIENSFSNINFNKTIENLNAQIRSLETEFDAISREFEDALKFDDDKSAERLGAKRAKIYDRIARARDKLAVEVAAAAQKEAAAEEKASQRIIAAEEKESAKRRQLSSDFINAGNSASYFGTRLRGIVSSAFIFNIISAGLRSVTSYFGAALMANNQFATAVYRLQGSLMVAFQPIYEAVLPALVTLINWLNVAVQAIVRFFTVLTGKSYSQMQSNAISLNTSMGNLGSSAGNAGDSAENMGDSIEDAGEKAKKAEKYLAGFDEINRMIREDTDDLSNSLDNLGNMGNTGLDDFKGPVFDAVELPTEWETAIDKLAMRFKDIFFEWENMTPEIIAEKLLTALTTIAGGIIGFALGGPGGALLGMVVGAGLGVVLSSIVFDGDGQLSSDELIHALVLALGMIGGAVIGFMAGGIPGAAIGIAVGAGVSMALSKIIFEKDGILSYEELEKSLLSVILTLGGAGIGFLVGGPGGALIGLTIGAGLSFLLSKAEITQKEGAISTDQLLNELLDILLTIGGTAIMFFLGGAIGGPVGAAIGAVVGLALSFALQNVEFGEVEQSYDDLQKKVGIWSDQTTQTTEERYIKPTSTKFQELTKRITSNIEQSKNSILDNMSLAATGVETTFFEPMAEWSTALADKLFNDNSSSAEKSAAFWTRAATGTKSSFFDAMTDWSTKLAEKIIADHDRATEKTYNSWVKTGTGIDRDFIQPTDRGFSTLGNNIGSAMERAEQRIRNAFIHLRTWFSDNVTRPIINGFNDLVDSIGSGLSTLVDMINSISQAFMNVVNQITSFSLSSVLSSSTSTETTPEAAMYAATPAIPQLARGAVIPPNHKFMAVLGDQKHGTNIEAPLATIQEAVAVVMDDVVQSNLAGFEGVISVLREILEAVLGIEIGDQILYEAVNRYKTKMAVVRGG